MYSIKKVNVPEGKSGEWSIEVFTVDRIDFRSLTHGRMAPPVGEKFTRLVRGGTLVMSDTPAEMRDHSYPVHRAQDNVLIAGLGLGMVLDAIASKPEVNKVTVIELSTDVISLVAPTYRAKFGDKVEIINADILTWKPPKGSFYDTAWFDIWDNICSDNVEQMKLLSRRFGRIARYKGFWCRAECERQYRADKRDNIYFDLVMNNARALEQSFNKIKSTIEGTKL